MAECVPRIMYKILEICQGLPFLPKDVSFSFLAIIEFSYLLLFFNFSISALIPSFFSLLPIPVPSGFFSP